MPQLNIFIFFDGVMLSFFFVVGFIVFLKLFLPFLCFENKNRGCFGYILFILLCSILLLLLVILLFDCNFVFLDLLFSSCEEEFADNSDSDEKDKQRVSVKKKVKVKVKSSAAFFFLLFMFSVFFIFFPWLFFFIYKILYFSTLWWLDVEGYPTIFGVRGTVYEDETDPTRSRRFIPLSQYVNDDEEEEEHNNPSQQNQAQNSTQNQSPDLRIGGRR